MAVWGLIPEWLKYLEVKSFVIWGGGGGRDFSLAPLNYTMAVVVKQRTINLLAPELFF